MNALDRAVGQLVRDVAARAILPRYRRLRAGDIKDKGHGDPVTIADREAEAMLAEGLGAIDPVRVIVGEEATHQDPNVLEGLTGSCWIVDPLDGTRNFAKGTDPFGIIIARADSGEVQSGWILDCLSGRFCCAHRRKGAFIDDERILARPSGESLPVAAISLLFMDDARRAATLRHLAPHYQLVDIPYCAAEQYPRLALGANDVSVFERTLAWDHGAGVLWLNEAGGMAARPDGSAYRVDQWERPGLLGAASPALWDKLAERYVRLG